MWAAPLLELYESTSDGKTQDVLSLPPIINECLVVISSGRNHFRKEQLAKAEAKAKQ